MSFNSKKSGQRGATLIETMIAIGILGIAVGTVSTFLAKTGGAVRGESAKEVQQMIAARVQSALANPEAISKSVNMIVGSNNRLLKACAIGPTAKEGNCNGVGRANLAREFELADAVVGPGGTALKLSGPFVGWTKDGEACSQGSPGCIFTVKTKFWATCAAAGANTRFSSDVPSTNCGAAQARFLNFKFVVDVDPAAKLGTGVPKLNPYPSMADYNKADSTGTVRMRSVDVVMRQGGDCGPANSNQRMVGIDKDGRPLCKCIDGSNPPTSGKNKGICQAQACPKGTLMVGFKESGNLLVPDCIDQASCEDPVTFNNKCPCKIIDLAPNVPAGAPIPEGAGDCGVGFWMVHINYGECKATTDKDGKGAPETVKCSEHTAKCCKTDAK